MTKPTDRQIEAADTDYAHAIVEELLQAAHDYEQSGPNGLANARVRFKKAKQEVIASLTAAAEVGEPTAYEAARGSYGNAHVDVIVRNVIAATIERCAQEKIDALVRIYRVNVAAAAAVALICDEQLDRSGALLQKIRDAAEIRALKDKP